MKNLLRILLIFFSCFVLFTCDTGFDLSTNDDQNSNSSNSNNNNNSNSNTFDPVSGYDLSLGQGTQWEFFWTYYNYTNWTASGSGMNPSTTTKEGFVTITLGDTTTISGKTLYEVTLSGDIPSTNSSSWSDNGNFWQYLGVDNGDLIGSLDGDSVKTIINAQQGISNYGFFIRDLSDGLGIESSNFTADEDAPISYTTTSHSVNYDYSEDNSISIPGIYMAGDEFSCYFTDYYKAGIGPIGHNYYHYWKDIEGPGEWSSGTTEETFTLISTSLEADDGFEPPVPIWQVAGDMPEVKKWPNAVFIDGDIYLMAGEDGSYNASQTVYRQEDDGSWTKLASIPVGWVACASGTGACVKDGKVYLAMKYNLGMSRQLRMYVYDPAADSWSLMATHNTAVDIYDCFLWGETIYIVGGNGVHYALNGEAIEDTAVYSLVSSPESLTYISALSTADDIFIVGQYKIAFNTYITGMWTVDNNSSYPIKSKWNPSEFKRRWAPGLAVYNNRLYVFGGGDGETAKKVVSCAIDGNGNVSDWQIHAPMLYGGTKLDALVVGNKIYVYGTDEGTKIEVYSPDDDN